MRPSLRLAIRRLRRAPGYAAAFILTLGLGIGINTAIFSVVNGVLLAPLPYADADRLVYVQQEAVRTGMGDVGFSFTEVQDLKRDARTIDAFVEYGDLTFSVVGEGDPHRAVGGIVTSNYFEVLGLRAQIGRTLREDDDGPGASPAMVLTDGYWKRVFGADTSVIGRTLRLYVFSQPKVVRVVGVLRPGVLYTGSRQQDFFVNYASNDHYGGAAMLDERAHRMTNVFARLAPGASVAAAQSELATRHSAMRSADPGSYPENLGLSVDVEPWQEALTSEARPMLLILAGTVALVLLLACANVANLSLTRLVRRERELSVQIALGAGVRRIRGELLVENLLLAAGGAALGVVLALVCRNLLVQYAGRFTVRTGEIAIDQVVLGATALVAAGAALLLAWLPPLPGTSGASAGRRVVGIGRKQVQRMLVVGQLALCFTLLVGATLLVRSLIRLNAEDAGLEWESVMALDVPDVTGLGLRRNLVLMEELTERVRALPGVRDAAIASHVPFSPGSLIRLTFEVEGRDAGTMATPESAQNSVGASYFETVGIAIERGRAFTTADREGSERVAILNASLARFLFEGRDALGGRIRQQQFNGEWGDWLRVVGIAADTREYGLANGATHTIYRPAAQSFPGPSLVVRAVTDPATIVTQVQSAIRELDPERPVDNAVTLEALRREDLAPSRLNATLFSGFAALALVIAAVGVLGVLGFSVSQRTQEFGLRMALGARQEQVLAMVIGEGGRMLAFALVTGAVGALVLSRFLQGILYQTATADPLTYIAVAVLLTAVALFAAWLPARRATRVDPVEALRAE